MGKKRDKKVLKILKKWFRCVDICENTFGNLMYPVDNVSALSATVSAGILLNKYDRTGNLSLLVLRDWFMAYGIGRITEEQMELTSLFSGKLIVKAEKYIAKQFKRIHSQLLVGDSIYDFVTTKNIITELNSVVNELAGYNVDIYKCGYKPLKLDNWCNEIRTYLALSDAVLDIEGMKDGVYVCYIANPQYFAIFIKSNGTLISINDRVNEKYAGELSGKEFYNYMMLHIFPYNSMRDIEGYTLKMQDNQVGFRFLVLMLLINLKYSGTLVEGERVYIDKLVENLPDGEKSTSEYWRFNTELDLAVTKNHVLYADEINTTDLASNLIDDFSHGFALENINCNTEFVGTEKELALNKIYQYRVQLANYIKNNIIKRVEEAGGLHNVYRSILLENQDRLLSLTDRVYNELEGMPGTWGHSTYHLFYFIPVDIEPGNLFTGDMKVAPENVLNSTNDTCSYYLDLKTQEECNELVRFNIINLEQLEAMIGRVEKLRDVFKYIGLEKGIDNLFCEVVDPVANIDVKGLLGDFSFNFGIALNTKSSEYKHEGGKEESKFLDTSDDEMTKGDLDKPLKEEDDTFDYDSILEYEDTIEDDSIFDFDSLPEGTDILEENKKEPVKRRKRRGTK